MDHISASQKRALSFATVLALLFGAFFLREYFSLFVISAIVVYLFWPLYTSLQTRMKPGMATFLTFIISSLAVIIPLLLIVVLAVSQASDLIDNLNRYASTVDLSALGESVVTNLNNLLARIPFTDGQVTEASLVEYVKSLLSNFGSTFVSYARDTAGSALGLVSTLILYIFFFVSLLQNGPTLLKVFRDLNPLGKDISDLYIRRTAAMVRGSVRGQFIIAITQGFIGAITIALAGLPDYFFIFWILFSAFSIIPLGSGIITLPLGVLFILFGDTVGGLIIILGHLFVTTNADNLLRPRLIPKEARLDPALMLVSVFSGIALFGFLGIVIGPTIMVLIVTTVQVYLDVFRDYDLDTSTDQPSSLSSRLKKFLRSTTSKKRARS